MVRVKGLVVGTLLIALTFGIGQSLPNVGLSVQAALVSPGQPQPPARVLVFTDTPKRVTEVTTVELALEELNVPFELYRDRDRYGEFVDALRDGAWDLVIIEAPTYRYDWEPLIEWVGRGGRLLSSLWDPSEDFFTAMGAQQVSSFDDPLRIYAWDGTRLFTAPHDVPAALVPEHDIFSDDGDRMEPLAGATALAGFTESPAPREAAIIMSDDRRTLINGFLFSEFRGADADGDDLEDIVELVANEIAFLLGPSCPTVEEIPLDPRQDPPSWQLGLPRTDSVQAHSFTRGTLVVEVSGCDSGEKNVPREYTVQVPSEGAELLAVVLESQQGGDLDLYARKTHPVEVPPEVIRVRSDFASISPGATEILVISHPEPDVTYWFTVENREEFAQDFTITAWLLPEIRDGQAGADGQVEVPADLPPTLTRYLQTDRGLLGIQQYRLEVPEGAERLVVQLEGEGDLNLHIRLGQPVGIHDEDGRVEADVSAVSSGGAKVIALLGSLLQAGTYYIAVEGLSPPQDFVLTVTLETEEGHHQTTLGGRLRKEDSILALIDLPW